MAVLIDTSFLVAVASQRDANHIAARTALRRLRAERVIPLPVLPETFYMVTKRVDYAMAMRMFMMVRTGAFRIESLTDVDMKRMQAIMEQYKDSQFDFVDTCLMALAERMNITDVYTFDRRDFTTFLPSHCEYLELLP